jgi:hypothetical protein
MKLFVLSGGRHAYQESTPILGNFLRKASHEVTVTEDAAVLAHATHLAGNDTLVFNTRREALPALPDLILSMGEQDGLKNFIRSGKAFVLLLSHDRRSFQPPAFQQLVLNSVDWATPPTAR